MENCEIHLINCPQSLIRWFSVLENEDDDDEKTASKRINISKGTITKNTCMDHGALAKEKNCNQSFSYSIIVCMSQINPILLLTLILIHVFTQARGHTERHKGLSALHFTNESVATLHVST